MELNDLSGALLAGVSTVFQPAQRTHIELELTQFSEKNNNR